MSKISIIAVCYNHSKYVIETLESILLQDDPSLDIMIIDDCSTDDSFDKIFSWLSVRQLNWRLFRNEINLGVSKTLNFSVRHISGDYIKFISCDDVLMPGAINNLSSFLKKQNNDCCMVFGDMEVIDETGETISPSYLLENNFTPEILKESLYLNLAKKCFVPAPATMIRKSVFNEFKFNEELYFEDWDFWLQLSKSYTFKYLNKRVVKYRKLHNSLFHALSIKLRCSLMKMAHQNLAYNKQADNFFKAIIIENAMINFINHGPNSSLWLWRRFTYTLRFRDFYYFSKSLIFH